MIQLREKSFSHIQTPTHTHTAANALDCISVTTCNTEHIVVVVVVVVSQVRSFVMQTEWTRPAAGITRLWIQLIFCDGCKNNKTAPDGSNGDEHVLDGC